MNLADWHDVLATEPATDAQAGAIHGEFRRLGYREADRAERLTVCAALLGLDGLGSTGDLVMGDAGRLLRILRGCADRAELAGLLPPPARVSGPVCAWAEMTAAMAETVLLMRRPGLALTADGAGAD